MILNDIGRVNGRTRGATLLLKLVALAGISPGESLPGLVESWVRFEAKSVAEE